MKQLCQPLTSEENVHTCVKDIKIKLEMYSAEKNDQKQYSSGMKMIRNNIRKKNMIKNTGQTGKQSHQSVKCKGIKNKKPMEFKEILSRKCPHGSRKKLLLKYTLDYVQSL
jgi:hypothetical protein